MQRYCRDTPTRSQWTKNGQSNYLQLLSPAKAAIAGKLVTLYTTLMAVVFDTLKFANKLKAPVSRISKLRLRRKHWLR